MSADDGGWSVKAPPRTSVAASATRTMEPLAIMRSLLDVTKCIDDLGARGAVRWHHRREGRDDNEQEPRADEQRLHPGREDLERRRRGLTRRRPHGARWVEEHGDDLAKQDADGRAEGAEQRSLEDEETAHARA